MLKLVYNEWLKMFKKRSFFVPFAVMLVGTVLFAYLLHATDQMELMSAHFFAEGVISMNGMGQMITLLTIISTAGVVAKEHSLGTIKLLLIRSQSRSRILASKYITVLIYSLVLTAFSLIGALLTGYIAFGLDAKDIGLDQVLMSALYQYVYTLVYVSLTFMIGVLTRASGATIGIGMFIVMIEYLVVELLSRYDVTKYLLFTNVNLSVYEEGATPPIQGMTLSFSLIILGVYLTLFLAASFVTFRKRDVA